MDNCVDCNRMLRDLFCRRCHMIYHRQVSHDMGCRNCGKTMIQQYSSSRFKCGFCQYRYLDMDKYNPHPEDKVREFMNSLEKECPECSERMRINPQNDELVCGNCGLVYEDPIYTIL